MSDTSSIRESASVRSLSRASTFLNRPHFAPMGPRARQSSLRTLNLLESALTPSPSSSLDPSGPRSLTDSPAPPSPTSSLPSSRPTSLPAVSEEPTSPVATIDDPPERGTTHEVTLTSQLSELEQAPVPSYPTPPSEVDQLPHPTFSPLPEIEAETSSGPISPPLSSESDPFAQAPVPDAPPPLNLPPPVPTKSEARLTRPPPSPVSLQFNPPDFPPPAVVPPAPASFIPSPEINFQSITAPVTAPENEHVHAPISTPELEHESALTPAPVSTQSDPPPAKFTVIPVALSSSARFVPPPAIKFESTPVAWKGLPHEAALWTIDSGELQEIVSRGIRSSAKESFIRLLTVNNLDVVLPAELERLENLKAVTQSKYRFLVHRRTMLFQALNSTTLGQQKDGEDGVSVVSRLASQLGDTIAECDRNLEQVISITDQMAQIHKLIDIHWSSALAIALRKLNGSYARRTADLNKAREKIGQLESELGEAWKEAEKMAKELDDYEAALLADDTDAIIEMAEVVPVPQTTPSAHTRRSSVPLTPTLLAFTPVSPPKTPPLSPISPTSPHPHHQFVFPPVVHLKAKETEAEDVPDTVSLRSTRSTRSAKSTKSHRSGWTNESNNNYSSAVHAAKTRSHRRSESSLRLNTGQHTRKHSNGRVRTPYEDHPPVPELPLQFTPFNNIMSAASANASSTLLHETGAPQLRRQVSLDSVHTGVGRPAATYAAAYRGRVAAADDLYVRLQNQFQYEHRNRSSQDIQLVPRTPLPAQNFAAMYEHHGSGSGSGSIPAPRPPPRDTMKTIPSMWMNADSRKSQTLHIQTQSHTQPQSYTHAQNEPQTQSLSRSFSNSKSKSPTNSRSPASSPSVLVPTSPAQSQPSASSKSSEHTESSNATGASNLTHQTSSRNSTYSKLRGLTKRYSVSLPLFNSQTRLPSRRSG
ncbi:hypothetical protein GALMADRAFT_153216 [Galerina marginata CBS 339.88]|uniref:Uncharacterized protein n=1 Tax=Galerina marginata (strain CBS 339.88) TaxID=685588 RepID=A0A067TC32_GALM3|nr:hypothetical protein GALMADRAFT_153216 [Galerina marginata CBS 339.88]